MVELIADRFVPVAIFNNHPGADAEILRRYDEPSWNNPVVRFLGPDGAELLPELADRYDALGLHEKITAALERLGDDVPGYFRLLGRDLLVEYRSEEHTSELQSLMRISYAVICLTKRTSN